MRDKPQTIRGITFETANPVVHVLIDGKRVGQIKNMSPGWRYFPKGDRKGGETFRSLKLCQDSLL